MSLIVRGAIIFAERFPRRRRSGFWTVCRYGSASRMRTCHITCRCWFHHGRIAPIEEAEWGSRNGEAPSTNIQAPDKSQAPSFKRAGKLLWGMGFGAFPELG